jgi:hypothetical protein
MPARKMTPAEAWIKQESEQGRKPLSPFWAMQVLPKDGQPTAEELVAAMLKDFRFKRIMLANAEHIFDSVPAEVKVQLFREAIRDLMNHYKVSDMKAIYRMLGRK